MAKSITWVLNMLETLFWCLSLGFGAWEIDWDQFQIPQIGLSGQNVRTLQGIIKCATMRPAVAERFGENGNFAESFSNVAQEN